MAKHNYRNTCQIGVSPQEIKNTEVFDNYFDWMSLIALTMFEYINLPDTGNERYLEWNFYFRGMAGAFDYGNLEVDLGKSIDGTVNVVKPSFGRQEIVTSGITPGGAFTPYQNYTWYTCYFDNGMSYQVPERLCVFGRNNYFLKPTYLVAEYYAYKIANLELTIDQNVNAQRMPYVIETDEDGVLSAQNEMAQILGFEPIIYRNTRSHDFDIKIHRTETPFIAPDLYIMRNNYWNEFLSYIGVNNANTTKRERLNTEEVQSNNELLGLSSGMLLTARKEFCNEYNRKFNPAKPLDVRLRDIELRRQLIDDMVVNNVNPSQVLNDINSDNMNIDNQFVDSDSQNQGDGK